MSSYYERELKQVLPINQYGLSVKFRSDAGESKWFMINQESLPIVKKFLDSLILSEDPDDCSIKIRERSE